MPTVLRTAKRAPKAPKKKKVSEFARNAASGAPTRNVDKTMKFPKAKRVPNARKLKHHPLAHAVCAVTNPFCTAAAGARWPDATVQRTLPVTQRALITNLTGADGTSAIAFRAQPEGIYYARCTGVDYAQTMPADWIPLCSIPIQDESRITSWGIRGAVTSPVSTSSGIICLASVGEPPSVLGTVNVSTILSNYVEIMPSTPGTTFQWAAKPINPVRTHQFRAALALPLGNIADADETGWQTLIVTTSGAPINSSTLTFDVIVNAETSVSNNNTLYRYTQPPEKPSPSVVKAAESLVSKTPQTQWNKTSAVVDDYFAQAATTVLGYIGSVVTDMVLPMLLL